MGQITKDMTMGYIVKEYPQTVQVFQRYGMGCLSCPTAQLESLEKGAMLHGLDVSALLEELNKALK
jgi:hybrid cluster-associated redox disulfide protein